MGKSLTDVAKGILMKEGAYPEVNPMGAGHPDRDAKKSNPNMATLKPGSKAPEADPKHNEAQDLGPALVKQGDVPGSAKAAGPVSKDTSKSAKAAVAAEKGKKQTEVMEEDVELDEAEVVAESEAEVVAEEEEFELSEELEAFIEEKLAEGLSEEEIAQAIDENFELVSEESEEVEEEVVAEEVEELQIDMSEHVEALLAGEELSEEFKEKATTIFEAAVKQKIEEELAKIEEAYAETLEEQVAEIKKELTENVDDYLNYVVEQWVSDNEVAITEGLRTELTEDFISGLRNLFAEHYIDIPEDKVSVVEEMAAKVAELEGKLNEEIDRNVELTRSLNESTQSEILADACEGLTDTQAEKLKSLAEGIEFTSAKAYSAKVATLKESYFTNSVKSENILDNEEVEAEGGLIAEEIKGPMASYVRALGKNLPK